jgi:hypothetical protein
VQVRGIPHDVGGVFVEMTAEDQRSGAHPYINTVSSAFRKPPVSWLPVMLCGLW